MVKSARKTSFNRQRMATLAGRAVGHIARAGFNRLARSRPATVRPRLTRQIQPVMNGSSQSFFKKAYKPRLGAKVLKAIAAPRTLVDSTSQRLTCNFGSQTATDVMQFDCATIARAMTYLIDGDGSQTQNVLLRNITQEYLFSNASSANTFVRIYEVTARNDFYSTVNSNVFTNAIWRPSGAYDQGIYDVNNLMSGLTLGVTPFQSKLFTQMYRIDKIYNIELGPGRTHKHMSTFSPNRIVHESRSAKNSILEGITRGVLILAYGSPVNDQTTNSLVSLSKVALNIVRKQTVTVSAVTPQGMVFYNTQALGAISTARHMDEDGDAQTVVES